MGAHGGESPTRKANARRNVAHPTVPQKPNKKPHKHHPSFNQAPIQLFTIDQNEPSQPMDEIWSRLYRREPEKAQVKIHKSGLGEL